MRIRFHNCSMVEPDYIERVVESVIDDPVKFREPKYVKPDKPARSVAGNRLQKAFVMVVGDRHQIHHVKDRGYVERPARVGALSQSLESTQLFETVAVRHFGDQYLTSVHDADFVRYLKTVCEKLNCERPLYPYVFPIRRADRRPRDLAVCAGYYCIDTFTPLDKSAFQAARQAVDVVLTGAEEILKGRPVVYALCRPPGHHAERRAFGGFCYFNNAAIAAQYFSGYGKVALLDIDYHHGNGSQDIFYRRSDVFTVSLHGHPNYSYPYFSGFSDEVGEDEGKGLNRNFPLPENTDETRYLKILGKALRLIGRFEPAFLVVSLGLDTMKGDPTGSFLLRKGSMQTIGRMLAEMSLPMLIVQEGGYNLRGLKQGATAFFVGAAEGLSERFVGRRYGKPAAKAL